MKLITRDTDYAVRALTCIEVSGGTVTVKELAEKFGLPRPFLRKILQILDKKGLVRSHKGKSGGFSLIINPKKISILDLVEIFQGPFQLNEHLLKGRICPRFKNCYLKDKIDKIEKRVKKELKAISIASLIKGGSSAHGKTKNNKN